MKLVYIAHPYGGDKSNLDKAEQAVIWALSKGVAPIAPWITFCRQLPETQENRDLVFPVNVITIRACDQVWLCGEYISPGMRFDAETAKTAGIPVRDFTGVRRQVMPTPAALEGTNRFTTQNGKATP